MPMNAEQYTEHYKKGHTINANVAAIMEAHAQMIEELLTAIEPTLKDAIDGANGDPANMFPEEQGLWEVYKSWDYYNRGRGRKTTEELLAPYQRGDDDAAAS